MLHTLLALALAVDGGGAYVTVRDYEFPAVTCSGWPALSVVHDTLTAGSYGTIGAAVPPADWDGGLILDAQGLRCIRGPTNIYYHFTPDWADAGKYEVCFTPSFDPSVDWVAGYDPDWNGTIYLFDAWDGSQHSAAIVGGYVNKGDWLFRLQNSTTYSSITANLSTPVGQSYCASMEWAADGGSCDSWVRFDGCGFTPSLLCHASTIVGFATGGACPSQPADVVVCNRNSTYRSATSVHINSIRVGRK